MRQSPFSASPLRRGIRLLVFSASPGNSASRLLGFSHSPGNSASRLLGFAREFGFSASRLRPGIRLLGFSASPPIPRARFTTALVNCIYPPPRIPVSTKIIPCLVFHFHLPRLHPGWGVDPMNYLIIFLHQVFFDALLANFHPYTSSPISLHIGEKHLCHHRCRVCIAQMHETILMEIRGLPSKLGKLT